MIILNENFGMKNGIDYVKGALPFLNATYPNSPPLKLQGRSYGHRSLWRKCACSVFQYAKTVNTAVTQRQELKNQNKILHFYLHVQHTHTPTPNDGVCDIGS